MLVSRLQQCHDIEGFKLPRLEAVIHSFSATVTVTNSADRNSIIVFRVSWSMLNLVF